ncbi:hypothetical protein [Methylomonas sp. UP202]|uniref:hypothetical protein n=1 Tax=Methylomonas sp. UP202 TaxID=3040943 RepID=UPI002478AF57|nr:hypothetical protein [Methylomonas sp. UP202]WGS86725.1 hypothetical protein QC632_02955 [Methylomonas sp. UP202]
MAFRTLNVLEPANDGRFKTRSLEEQLQSTPPGYHAFYFDPSALDDLATTRASELRDLLLQRVSANNRPNEIAIVDALSLSDDQKLSAGKIYLVGKQFQNNYAGKTSEFLRDIRKVSAPQESPFSESITFALHQASSYELRGERSWFLSNTLKNYEYFLWDDGDLWSQAQWDSKRLGLEEKGMSPQTAEQRLAWLGSGSISLQLDHLCQSSAETLYFPPALAQLLEATISRLGRFDQAVLDYYRENKNSEPSGFNHSDYVRLLCDFLPDHRSRLNSEKFLNSNSLGDDGGPRPWQGVSDWRMEMKLMHLLLDGLLTLWPKDPDKESSEGTELMLQPGSLAILYWAARTADMPWTKTPTEFLKNYQWDDPNWFGGRRQRWLGNEWQASS